MAAYITLRLVPADHQALQALLSLLTAKIDMAGFRAALAAQGRRVENIPDDDLVKKMAYLLINALG